MSPHPAFIPVIRLIQEGMARYGADAVARIRVLPAATPMMLSYSDLSGEAEVVIDQEAADRILEETSFRQRERPQSLVSFYGVPVVYGAANAAQSPPEEPK